MSVMFQITKSEEFVGATVIIDGKPYPVAKDHPSYNEIESILLGEETPDQEYLLGLLQPIKGISDQLIRLSDRVSIKGTTLYFDGDVINSSLVDHIIKIVHSENREERDGGYAAFVNFLEKLMTNPSEASRKHLFDFAAHHGLTITDEGDLLLYKSTNEDGTATHSGYGIVTTAEGVSTIYERDYLPNAVGSIVEIPRSMVDENRHAACSVGLHVGAFSYASTYSQKLWNVVVNPRDVVSVPHDSASAKIRVARYQILSDNPKKQKHEGHSIDLKKDTLPGAPAEVVAKFIDKVDAEVKADEKKAGKASSKVSRVPEYKALIPQIVASGKKLQTFRNKNVTAARRAEFDQAVAELGLSYS